MNPKIEDLRKKAYLVYGGYDGVELVNKEVRNFGILEDQLNAYQMKIVLNNIIKHVFIDKIGLDESKIVLGQKVTHVPGYHSYIQKDDEKIQIKTKIDFMKTIVKVIIVFFIIIAFIFWFYMSSFSEREFCETKNPVKVRDKCYNSMALNTVNHTLCSNISIQKEAHNCHYYVAIKAKDHKICEKIPAEHPEHLKTHVKCMTCLANIERNSSICELIKDFFSQRRCKETIRADNSLACTT